MEKIKKFNLKTLKKKNKIIVFNSLLRYIGFGQRLTKNAEIMSSTD